MTDNRVENSSGRAARKLRLALMGPAFIAAIGYIDPGNFATNIQAGASFGYQLPGGGLGEPDGDADSNPLGKTRNRHGQNGGANSRPLSAPGSLVLLGTGGNHRDGHRFS